tara:strand:- start:591 stop:1199 length:609 start_codon:yes stop_codon:yes gene_type:complete
MRTKLYFGVLAVFLAFLGTFLEQSTIPNQQIVIQFSDEANNIQDTENAIEEIQEKLQSIGVTQIQIGQTKEGQFRIIYYSDTDVEHIQNILFNVNDLELAYDASKNQSNFPENKKVNDYELNVSEIKTSNNLNWDCEGTQVTEINQKTDQSNQLKVNYSGKQVNIKQSNKINNVAVLVNNTLAIAIDRLSYKIPEVRAGPVV